MSVRVALRREPVTAADSEYTVFVDQWRVGAVRRDGRWWSAHDRDGAQIGAEVRKRSDAIDVVVRARVG